MDMAIKEDHHIAMFIQHEEQETAITQLEDAYILLQALIKAKEEICSLQIRQKESDHKIAVLEQEIVRLNEQLQLAQQRHFGKKKETGDIVAPPEVTPLELEKVTVGAYTRNKKTKKHNGRVLDTSELPRFAIHHDIKDEDKHCCTCHGLLHLIGKETAEQLEILPQRFYIAEHIRYKYGCRHCETIAMAPKEPAPIPKSLAGASLLTEVIINKYHAHLPLYRQSKMIENFGLLIPDNTLGNWVMKVGEGLMVLYDALWQSVQRGYLQVDETPIKVQKPDKQGYLWCYLAPLIGIIIFEMSLTRGSRVVESRLAQFKGLLQTDGYFGYNGMRKKKDVTGFGCATHARRKYVEVFKISKDPDGIAAQMIEKLKPLYALEERMRASGYSFHLRKRLRQKIGWRIWKDIRRWLIKMRPQVSPKSKLAEAIDYTFKQWPYIIRYLRHGMAEIDTNWVENEIRNVALGKKNWLFVGNESSGKVHALFFSLVGSAILNDINPRVYIHYLITQIHDLRLKKVDPVSLLPHKIDKNMLQAFSDKIIAEGKIVLNAL
jgi:transposase